MRRLVIVAALFSTQALYQAQATAAANSCPAVFGGQSTSKPARSPRAKVPAPFNSKSFDALESGTQKLKELRDKQGELAELIKGDVSKATTFYLRYHMDQLRFNIEGDLNLKPMADLETLHIDVALAYLNLKAPEIRFHYLLKKSERQKLNQAERDELLVIQEERDKALTVLGRTYELFNSAQNVLAFYSTDASFKMFGAVRANKFRERAVEIKNRLGVTDDYLRIDQRLNDYLQSISKRYDVDAVRFVRPTAAQLEDIVKGHDPGLSDDERTKPGMAKLDYEIEVQKKLNLLKEQLAKGANISTQAGIRLLVKAASLNGRLLTDPQIDAVVNHYSQDLVDLRAVILAEDGIATLVASTSHVEDKMRLMLRLCGDPLLPSENGVPKFMKLMATRVVETLQVWNELKAYAQSNPDYANMVMGPIDPTTVQMDALGKPIQGSGQHYTLPSIMRLAEESRFQGLQTSSNNAVGKMKAQTRSNIKMGLLAAAILTGLGGYYEVVQHWTPATAVGIQGTTIGGPGTIGGTPGIGTFLPVSGDQTGVPTIITGQPPGTTTIPSTVPPSATGQVPKPPITIQQGSPVTGGVITTPGQPGSGTHLFNTVIQPTIQPTTALPPTYYYYTPGVNLNGTADSAAPMYYSLPQQQ